MRVEVNGARIFFDVEGAKLVPDGPPMREKPTLILVHGGFGADHTSQNLAAIYASLGKAGLRESVS
jgi:hypothetical protein